MEIKGTIHKQNSTDTPIRCNNPSCGKMFYVRRENGVWVVCPYCGKRH